jgi:Calx-beta domain-containing protein
MNPCVALLRPLYLAVILAAITQCVSAATLKFKAAKYTAREAAGSVLVTVMRVGTATNTVTVDYMTMDGSATANDDYLPVSGTLTFTNRQTKATFSVPIINDSLVETNETVNLILKNPQGGDTLAAPSNAVLTIMSDDRAGTLAFSAKAYSVDESAGVATITVNRKSGTASRVMIDFTTQNGTAVAGTDYTAASGTLIFGSNELSKTFTVPIQDDSTPETNKTVLLLLSNPRGGATLPAGGAKATLTILDDESSFQFGAASYNVSETMASVTITVTRTGRINLSNSVDFATGGGTATPGADFTPVSGTLNFPSGTKSRTFTIPILRDPISESTETVTLTLSNPTRGGVLGTPAMVNLNIANAPDPNGVPANGPEFMTASGGGSSFSALPAAIVATYQNGLLNITGANASTSGQRTLQFGALPVSGPGTVILNESGNTGTATYTEISVGPPPSAFGYLSNRTGGGGTVTIDVFDTVNKVVAGRFNYTGVQEGFNPNLPATVQITGSFRAFIQ